jgi:hypothetical protein
MKFWKQIINFNQKYWNMPFGISLGILQFFLAPVLLNLIFYVISGIWWLLDYWSAFVLMIFPMCLITWAKIS